MTSLKAEIDVFSILGMDLASTTHAETAARIILNAAKKVIGWDASYLILYDPQKGGSPRPLLTIDTINDEEITQSGAAPTQPSENMLRAIDQGGFLSTYESYFDIAPSMSFGDKSKRTLSQMFVPVISGTRTIGVLSIQSYKKHAYSDEQLTLLKNLASLCAGALERIWAQEALGDLVARLKILHEAVNEINASHDVETVCRVVYETVERVMPCNDFVMDGYDKETNEIIPLYAIEHPRQRIYTTRYFADHGLAGEIVKKKDPILFRNKADVMQSGIRFEVYGLDEEQDPTESILAVPMLLHDEIFGMVSAQSYQKNAYTVDDVYLLETLASHAAIAIENARLFDSIRNLANTDPLTGILNRRRFFELAEAEFIRAGNSQFPLCVILLDIDDFKMVNDRYGHKIGDFILTQTTQACKTSLRENDIFGRLGGEEFVVALPFTPLDKALEVADRLRQTVNLTDYSSSADLPASSDLSITVSVGVAEYEPDCRSLDVLIERADQAMYRSKNSGRNQVQAWKPPKATKE